MLRGTRTADPRGEGPAVVLRVLRLVIVVFLALDVGFTLIGQAIGMTGLGPSGAVAAAQMICIVGATAAVLWSNARLALLLSAAVVVLALVVGPVGSELWLVLISGVLVAARARTGYLLGLVGAQLAFAAAAALVSDRRHPGWGWSTLWSWLAVSLVACVAGLVARQVLAAAARRRNHLQHYESETGRLRARERGRLADELQAMIVAGLADIETSISDNRLGTGPQSVRTVLEGVEDGNRRLLQRIRALMEVLREPVTVDAAGVAVGGSGRKRWSWLQLRPLRMVGSAVLIAAALRVVLSRADVVIEGTTAVVMGLTLVAYAGALWSTRLGLALAVVTTVVATVLQVQVGLEVAPVVLAGATAAFSIRLDRTWVVLAVLTGGAAVIASTGPDDQLGHAIWLMLSGVLGTTAGLVTRHFVRAHAESTSQLLALVDQRRRADAEERDATARELHDVVAAQLSTATMTVMAARLSDDPVEHATALERARRCLEVAEAETTTLLHALRGVRADHLRPPVLTAPTVVARSVADQLTQHGFQAIVEVDEEADSLDETTQRTLARILQESTVNIVRYAPSGTACHYRLQVLTDQVTVTVESPLAEQPRDSSWSTGWGLLGLGERVQLTSGTFDAGPRGRRWVVEAVLPRAAVLAAADSRSPVGLR